MKHNLNASPVSVDTVKACQIVNGIQSSFVFIKTLQSHFIPQNGEKFLKVVTMIIVVKYLLFSKLSFLDVNHPNFQLRLDKDLQKRMII